MSDNYSKLVRDNHTRLYKNMPSDMESILPTIKQNRGITFNAFGGVCRINATGFHLNDEPQEGVIGILLSLYALNANHDPCILEPFKAYKEFPGTMPYVGAFATHTEHILLPHVANIKKKIKRITTSLDGHIPAKPVSGDFSFIVYPLPKLALCYIFYEDDDEFPPSVTCLYSNNASRFMPNDALADVGEYTSKTIINLIQTN
ncbi:MAG: DUF3786 domain-containing protein [Proteobacteria bacterium]|nr:DUF3786 domain-containing protein [Pseudomonadota bacterium]